MTLQHVTDNLAAKALAKPGITHGIQLQRGLRIALRYRRQHYTLSISRSGVFPSIAERAILRRSFAIPTDRKWRTTTRNHLRGWYIFWNPDNSEPVPAVLERRQLPITYPAGVGPEPAQPTDPGSPT